MSPWIWLLDGVGLGLLLMLLTGVALVVRRRSLSRHGGTFELSWRIRQTASGGGRGWLLGLGRYTGDELEWFRIFSLAPRPKRRWHRSELSFVGKRQPEGVEEISLYADHLVVTMDSPDGPVEFAMSPSSLTGLQAWLEAGLPQPPRA